jgi:23S rRNA (uridine2552-2'-O)-methyltransferase
LELAETVIEYAQNALALGGNLVVKVFQGGGVDAVLKRMKTLFTTAKSYKPEACRNESVETYFIGLGRVTQK